MPSADTPRPTRVIEYAGVAYTVTKAHPAADALPWHLDRPTFAAMVEDMRTNGFDPAYPVVLCSLTGLLIIGRHRELAAAVVGVDPVYRYVEFADDDVGHRVKREDLFRRQLDPVGWAATLVKINDLFPHGCRRHAPQPSSSKLATCSDANQPDGQSSKLATLAEIADETGVSKRTVQTLNRVKQDGPELLDVVIEGRLPVNTAGRVAALPAEARVAVAAADDPKAAAKSALAAAREVIPVEGEDLDLDDLFGDDAPAPPPPTVGPSPRPPEPKRKRPRRFAFHQDIIDDLDALARKITRRYHESAADDPLRDNLNRVPGAMDLGDYAVGDDGRSGARCLAFRQLRLALKLAGPGCRKRTDTEFAALCKQALTNDPDGYWARKRKAQAG